MPIHAYIFHEDGSVTELHDKPTLPEVTQALKQQMDGCEFTQLDITVRDDGGTWMLTMDAEGSFMRDANLGLGGHLMHLELRLYGKVALTRSSAKDPQQLEALDPLPKGTMKIYEHLTQFRNDWRHTRGLPPCK